MSAVRNWLEEIGLAQYADAFEANDIDTDLLTQVDDQVLKDIGVSSAGHRLRLRNAIAKLAPTSIAEGISEALSSLPFRHQQRLYSRQSLRRYPNRDPGPVSREGCLT
jgi:hypothetical protein